MSILGGSCSPCCGQTGGCTDFYDGTTAVSSTGWVAGGFTTPPGGLTLSSATIYIDSAATSATISQLRLQLYSSTAGLLPNALVVSLTAPGSLADTLVWTAPDEPLTGSTLYYLVFRTTAGSSVWKYEGYSNPDDNAPCELYYTSISSDGGANWFPPGPFSEYQLFDIN
jgi:hypothetical protein